MGRCGEGRQEMRESVCVEMCENGKQVCRVVPFIPPSQTQHISQHRNTLLKKVLLIAYFQQCLVYTPVMKINECIS